MKYRKLILGGSILVIAVGAILFGKRERLNGYFSAVKLQFLINYMKDNYLYDIDETKGLEGIYSGYVDALGNNGTYYLDKEELKNAKLREQGDYFGIGLNMMWSLDEHYLIVSHVDSGSPAEKAGIKVGDCITQVGDIKVTSSNESKIKMLIYSNSKAGIKYEVKRGDKVFNVSLAPEKVIVNDLEYEMMDDIFYMKLVAIKDGTSKKMKNILKENELEKSNGIILDLRGLSTDNVKEIKEISDLFLDKEVAFKIQSKKDGVVAYETEDGACHMPLVLITNAETSGGAEALVLALKGRAKIVGSTTNGNPYIKKIISFEDGTGMSVASAMISDRYGKTLSKEGIEPDKRLYIGEKEKVAMLENGEITKEQDSYLQGALALFQ